MVTCFYDFSFLPYFYRPLDHTLEYIVICLSPFDGVLLYVVCPLSDCAIIQFDKYYSLGIWELAELTVEMLFGMGGHTIQQSGVIRHRFYRKFFI